MRPECPLVPLSVDHACFQVGLENGLGMVALYCKYVDVIKGKPTETGICEIYEPAARPVYDETKRSRCVVLRAEWVNEPITLN